MSYFTSFRYRVAQWVGCCSGAAALIFGLTLLPLGGAVAVGVEYNRATALKSQLQAAADAAVLAAIAAPPGAEVETANRQFLAHLAGKYPAAVAPLVVTVTSSGGDRTVRAGFAASMPTPLGGLLGRGGALDLAGRAEANNAVAGAPYLDIHVVLDTSASMTVAADEAGRDRLRVLTLPLYRPTISPPAPLGCAFACHSVHSEQYSTAYTFYNIASANGIKTRGDVVRDSLSALSIRLGNPAGRTRMALYTFSTTASIPVPLTSNLSAFRSGLAVASDLDTTAQVTSMSDALSAIGSNGSGSSAWDAKKSLVVVTDGLTGGNPWSSPRVPFDPSLCAPFKARGVDVVVLHTT